MVSDAMQGESDAEFIERAMRRWIGLVAARDIDGLEAYLEEFYEPNAWIDFGTRTPDAIAGEGVGVIVEWARGAFKDWGDNDADFRYELFEVEDTGAGVIAPARSVGRMQGYELEIRFTYLFQVRRGKITSLTMYETPEQARAAASGRPKA